MYRSDMERYYRSRYHEAREEAFASGKLDKLRQNNGVYTSKMLARLRDMARNDVYPDGSFSDDECEVWCMLHKG